MLAKIKQLFAENLCLRLGHRYDWKWTDICFYSGTCFFPAVWCSRCARYVPDPKEVAELERG